MDNHFKKLVGKNLILMAKKSKDYSRDNIAATGTYGVAVRLLDKVVRLLSLTNSGNVPNFESIQDTFADVSNYGLIGQSLNEGSWEKSTRLVYLAGPIDDISIKESHNWREDIARRLAYRGISSFNPAKAYTLTLLNPPSDLIKNINRFAIEQCDVVVVYLYGEGKGYGTMREIEYAKNINKRVIVIGNLSEISSHLEMYDIEIVETVIEAIERVALVTIRDPLS